MGSFVLPSRWSFPAWVCAFLSIWCIAAVLFVMGPGRPKKAAMPKEAYAYKDFFSVGGRPGVVRSLDQPGKAAPGRPANKQRCGDEGGPSRGPLLFTIENFPFDVALDYWLTLKNAEA